MLSIIVMLICIAVIFAFSSCKKKKTDPNSVTTDNQLQEGVEDEETSTPLSDACIAHVFDEGVIIKEATCSEKGSKKQTCEKCNGTREVFIPMLAHDFDKGVVTLEPTLNTKGKTLYTCKTCGFSEEREDIDMLPCAYTITMEGIGQLNLPADGIYKLDTPKKLGYSFVKWVDSEGNDFASSGTVKKDVTVKAIWAISDTKTIAELEERAAAGVAEIRVANDIIIDRPIFFTGETNLFASGNVKLTRKSDYSGDIFVIGQDKNGTASVVLGKQAILTIGGNDGTITIDGNSSELKLTVAGSALFVCDSAAVNIKDGTVISNHKKLDNERSIEVKKADIVGGAAIAIMNGTVKMYGGTIENNIVVTEYTKTENADGTTTSSEIAACGGAIYNAGSFYMYGGTITKNEALRGGAIYNNGVVYLEKGTISNNTAHSFGGALSSSSRSSVQTYVGTETDGADDIIFLSNHCTNVGGALYSATNSPIVVLGNTQFNNNTADGSGGAIYASSGLTIRDAAFSGNSCAGSGGAIYYCYNAANRDPRTMELTDCSFANNEAKLGGAVILSASDPVLATGNGAIADITGCSFTNNISQNNGGAVYVTRNSEANIKSSVFTGNVSSGQGGALFVSGAKANIGNTTKFSQNSATGYGGAVYICEHERNETKENGETEKVIIKSVLKIDDTSFEGNTAARGGALYVSKNEYTLSNVTFEGNSAIEESYGGGAIYCTESTGTLDAITFKNNTSHKGGAVALHTNSSMTVSSMTATGNSATANSEGKLGDGGVFYVINSTLSLAKSEGKTIVIGGENALGNTAVSGGAIHATNATLNFSGVSFIGNSAQANGGAVYTTTSTVTSSNSEFKKNTSGNHGGAINIIATNTTFEGDNLFDGNTAANHGGAIYVVYLGQEPNRVGSNLTVTGGTFKNNSAMAGGAVSIRSASEATFNGTEFKDNTVTGATENLDGDGEGGGAVYVGYGTLNLKSCTFNGNNSSYGFGGAVNACASTLKIEGKMVISSNTVGTGSSKSAGNVHLTKNQKITVSGVMEAGSAVGVTTDSTIFVEGDVPVSYKDFFTSDEGKVVFTNGTSICLGDTPIIDQPWAFNNFTVNADADTYKWYQVSDRNTVVCEGKTLADAKEGEQYVCVMTLGGRSFESNTVTYYKNKTHALCGQSCDHSTDSAHEQIVYIPISNAYELREALDRGGNYYLACDVEVSNTLCVNKQTVLCLNGKVLSAAKDADDFTMIKAVADFTLTDCNSDEHTGYIDRESGLWVSGAYTGEGTVDVVVLKGGMILGAHAKNGGAISTTATLKIYNVNFVNNVASANGGAIYVDSAAAEVIGSAFISNNAALGGAIYTRYATFNGTDVTFKYNTATSNGGAIDFVGTTATFTGNNLFEKNTAANHAGAIYVVYGTLNDVAVPTVLTMTDGTFLNNSALAGGAISVRTGCTVNFNGTLFEENSVAGFVETETQKLDGNGEGGGAIYVGYGELNFKNCIFKKNTSSYGFGGAIDICDSTVTIEGGSFTGNTALDAGGAISMLTSSVVTIDGVTFTENAVGNSSVATNGGAINSRDNSTLIIKNSTFSSNTSTASGGAIYASKTVFECENSTFSENKAAHNGGAMYIISSTDVKISGSTFTANQAKDGGAIYTHNSTITCSDSTFKKNSASNHGGAIDFAATNATLTGDNLFEENTAANHAGAVYVVYATLNEVRVPSILTMTGGTFLNNSAMAGGAVSIRSDCTASFDGTLFEGNTATGFVESETQKLDGDGEGGGAIYVGYGALNLKNSTFEDNTSSYGYGGAIDACSATVSIEGGLFTGNSTSQYGGVIASIKSTDLTVNGVTFTSNRVGNDSTSADGGVIYASSGKLTVINSSFTSNTATKHGGAICVSKVELKITGSSFIENQAPNNGGAIYIVSIDGAEISGSTFEGNESSLGGAMYVHDSVITYSNTTFKKNSSTNNGGAIDFVGTTATLTDANLFEENTATNYGGAIYLSYINLEDGSKQGSVLTMTGGEFKNNSATNGGAVSGRTASDLTFNNVKFTSNKATGDYNNGNNPGGGAIHINTGKLTVVGGIFDGNSSGYYGGAITGDGTAVTISNGTIIRNSKSATGAALYFKNSSNVIVDTITVENNAASGSGVIYFNSGTNSLTNVTASGNTSNKGGVFYISGGTVTIADSTLNGNFATVDGSVLHSSGSSNVTVTNTEMKDNGKKINSETQAVDDYTNMGGAVYVEGNNNLKLEGCTITGNGADLGGGIYSNKVTYTKNSCTIENNTSTTSGAENEYTKS